MKLFSFKSGKIKHRLFTVFAAVSVLMSALFSDIVPGIIPAKAEIGNDSYVLRIEPNTEKMPFFGQWVSLKVGKTYIYSNCYLPETEPHQCIYKNTNDGQITDYEVIPDVGWWGQGIKFTVPSDAMDDPNAAGNKLVWVGFRGYKINKPLYYCNFKLYDVDNPEINLLKDSDLLENGAALNKNVWISPYNTEIKNTLSKVSITEAGGINTFKKNYAIKLEPNTTGQPYFGQRVLLEAGKTYIYSNCFLSGTDGTLKVCCPDQTEIPCEIINDEEWSKQSLKFTVPETAPTDRTTGKKRIFVGFRGSKSDKPLYYYGFELYEEGKTGDNLLADSSLTGNGENIDTTVWTSPSGTRINANYSKVSLGSVGGLALFVSYKVKCDLTGDGVVDIRDLLRMMKFSAGLVNSLPEGAGDLNCDNTIADASDITLLIKEILK